MGIKGLLPELAWCSKGISIRDVCQSVGKRVAIDGMCWLHRFGMVCARDLALQTGKADEKIVEKIVKILNAKINILFDEGVSSVIIVFDGGKVALKKEVEDERAKKRDLALRKGKEALANGNRNVARKCFNAAIRFTGDQICAITQRLNSQKRSASSEQQTEKNTPKHFEAVVAPYESDAQLAYLYSKGKVDWIISEDSDLLVFGCDSEIKVLYKLDFGTASGVLYDMSVFTSGMASDTTRFVHGCIIAGCDYLPSLQGVGIKRAMQHISVSGPERKSVETLLRELNAPLAYEKRVHQAHFIFRHQPVFDPDLGICVPLTSYTEDDLKGMSSTDFAGRLYSTHSLVKSIYYGRLHPTTHAEISVGPLPPSTLRSSQLSSPRSHKRQRLITDYFTKTTAFI